MVEITFSADPGADDILIDGVSLNDIDAFGTECLSGGVVSCDWDTLHARLTNHDVSKMWWFLTESERRSIAKMAIENTLFFILRRGRSGKYSCLGGEGDTRAIVCLQNAIIRYIKFTSKSFGVSDRCYYRKIESSEEFCYVPDDSYGLPGHIVSCSTPAAHEDPFGHSMCAIQVDPDISKLDNWIVFQYNSFDIKPGHTQMRTDTRVRFQTPDNSSTCNGYGADTIAEFWI